MKIIKTRVLDFSEGDPGFFEKSYLKFLFSFHGKYENFSEFYNLRRMSVGENHEISRENSDPAHDFMKIYPLKMEASRYCGPPQKIGSP